MFYSSTSSSSQSAHKTQILTHFSLSPAPLCFLQPFPSSFQDFIFFPLLNAFSPRLTTISSFFLILASSIMAFWDCLSHYIKFSLLCAFARTILLSQHILIGFFWAPKLLVFHHNLPIWPSIFPPPYHSSSYPKSPPPHTNLRCLADASPII